MKEYLVIEYTKDHDKILHLVSDRQLIKILDQYRNEVMKKDGNPKKIAVYEVGDVILDWS